MSEDLEEDILVGVGDAFTRQAKRLLGMLDTPAYLRRAAMTEAGIEQVLQRCRCQREKWLDGVRLRLSVWQFLVARQEAVLSRLSAPQRRVLDALADAVPALPASEKPWLKPGRPAAVLADLATSVVRFNRRWEQFAATADTSRANRLIDGYNRYYVFEKECAFYSARLAARGFQPIEKISREWILARFPLLPELP